MEYKGYTETMHFSHRDSLSQDFWLAKHIWRIVSFFFFAADMSQEGKTRWNEEESDVTAFSSYKAPGSVLSGLPLYAREWYEQHVWRCGRRTWRPVVMYIQGNAERSVGAHGWELLWSRSPELYDSPGPYFTTFILHRVAANLGCRRASCGTIFPRRRI